MVVYMYSHHQKYKLLSKIVNWELSVIEVFSDTDEKITILHT